MGGNKKRRHGGASIAVNDAPQMQIGEVGYEFRKLFNQGWFQGKVVKIRPGAAGGRDRRVVYSDGDQEDLSLDDLRVLSMKDTSLKKVPDKGSAGSAGNLLGHQRLKGISLVRSGRWQMQIFWNGRSRYIGTYDTKAQASKAHAIALELAAQYPHAQEAQAKKMIQLVRSRIDESMVKGGSKERRVPQVKVEKMPTNKEDVVPVILPEPKCGSQYTKREAVDIITKYPKKNPARSRAILAMAERMLVPVHARTLYKWTERSENGEDIDDEWHIHAQNMKRPAKADTGVLDSDTPLPKPDSVDSSLAESTTKLAPRDTIPKKRSPEEHMDNPLAKRPRDPVDSIAEQKRILKESFLGITRKVDRSLDLPLAASRSHHMNEDDEDSRLCEIAATLGAASRSSKRSRAVQSVKSDVALSSSPLVTANEETNPDFPDEVKSSAPSNPSLDATGLPLLGTIPLADRHELKVIRKNAKLRIVGEVLMSEESYASISIGEELKQYHVNHLLVVPSNFKVGEILPKEFAKAEEPTPKPMCVIVKREKATPPLQRKSSSPPSQKKPTLTAEDIFCWYCAQCDARNGADTSACSSCGSLMKDTCSRSALMKLVEDVIDQSSTTEEAIDRLPVKHRESIPACVVERMIALRHGAAHPNSSGYTSPPCTDVDNYYYWDCGQCTMRNNWRRTTCSVCRYEKFTLADRSPLLQIADDAAQKSNNLEEAMARIPTEESVPCTVVDALVTCVFLLEGKKGTSPRRCRKPRMEGFDFCPAHCDPKLLSKPRPNVPSPIRNSAMGIAALSKVLPPLLSETNATLSNPLGWGVRSVEDAIICGDDQILPMGLKVRKYFGPLWGFHDGRIAKVYKESFVERDGDDPRECLCYRVIYNDGDQEDFNHDEVVSLTQIYDRRNVDPEAAAESQIAPGAHFEMKTGQVVNIVCHKENNDGISVIFEILGYEEQIDHPLSEFQFCVARRLDTDSERGLDKRKSASLEWPDRKSSEMKATDEDRKVICNGLVLHRRPVIPSDAIPRLPSTDVINNSDDVRPCCDAGSWDPSGIGRFLSFDPHVLTICEICGIDDDDDQVVICDRCSRGFHTYCLRPVMVNIPQSTWLCSACSGEARATFEEFKCSLALKESDNLKFLKLPIRSCAEFFDKHHEAVSLFAKPQSAIKQRAKSEKSNHRDLFKVQGINFVKKYLKNDWLLPTSSLTVEAYATTVSSIVSSMKYCGMEQYSTGLIYTDKVTEDMNDPSKEVEKIEPMSMRNLQILRAFRENMNAGVLPPIEIVHDENYGFSVKCLAAMDKHTLIGEYVGECVTMEASSRSSSDSLMVLLDTSDAATSLIIDPSRAGNYARFLSGVNNRSLLSKRKQNVRTRRFFMDGKVHVALFTAKKVEAGEVLNYDYNAGIEGKDVQGWARTGFYDTRHFF
mmetsp:Transcript_14316/g.31390  ORF Transcript_14316/g.31390 Transcript_14316/m.31390 type:complete len:1414 (-) Transcript_14316:695-4936(-)